MKYFFIIIFSLFIVESGFSQKIDSLVYIKSFNKAKYSAYIENKNLLLIFSGSDWCKSCIIFDKTILQDSMFIAYANKNLIVYKADFPRKHKNLLTKEKQNENDLLASKYNKRGEFPKVLLFSSKIELKAVLQYNHITVKEFINQIKKYLL